MSLLTKGITKLSELAIDVTKDWAGKIIENLGDPVNAQDAATKAWVLTNLPTGGATIVRKTVDETVNNSATIQDDDELFFAVAANEAWEFTINLWWSSTAAADLDFAITVPSGSTFICHTVSGYDTSGTGLYLASWTSGEEMYTYCANSPYDQVMTTIKGIVVNGATAGKVQLQWAQHTATAVDTTVKANSHIIAQKLA